ncbi:MAG: sensor histidine kinase [Candidatus Scalindua sp.]
MLRTIKSKLIIFSLCISLIPILVLTTIFYLNARSTLKNQILRELTAIAESKRIHILSFIGETSGRVADFSTDGFIRDSLKTISYGGDQNYAVLSMNTHLKDNKKPLDPHITAIAVVGIDGKVVSSTNEEIIGEDVSKHDIYIKSIRNAYGETYVGHTYRYSFLDEDCIFISAPILDKHGGEKIGIIINAYDLASLNEITTNRVGMGETGEVYIVNKDKVMITESRFIEDVILNQVVDTEPVRRIVEYGKGAMTGIYPDYRGIPIVGASADIPEFGWILLAEMDIAEAFAPLKLLRNLALILCGICSAVVISVGILFSISTARPINSLKYASEKIADGDLGHRVKITRNDEIGALANSFNTMTSKLANEIAEHKRAEDELAATNKELEAFCYSVSHDLRAPLRGIDGFSKILETEYEHKLDGQGMGYLKRIRAASQRMGQLISDLLNLSRITRREMKQKKVDLSAMVHKIAFALQKRQPERVVEFIIEEGISVSGDTNLLQIAMDNLLGNAWKFTEKHFQSRIEFGITKNDSGHVYFIRDDGAGFDMTYVDKLFGAFQRLHSLNEFEGTGIGLATVQRIIHRHGGRIWAEGAEEQGATFYFTL